MEQIFRLERNKLSLNDNFTLIRASCFLRIRTRQLGGIKQKEMKKAGEAADPGSKRTKEQGGAAPGRVRGRVSRRTTVRGVGGRVQVRRRRRGGNA